jgi:hypothetical protein
MLPEWQNVDRLLVACSFQQSAAAVQLKPAMQVLKQNLPQTSIIFLTSEILTSEITQYGFIEENSLTAQTINQPLLFLNRVETIERLRLQPSDVAILFTEPSQSCYTLAYLCYLSHIPIRIGQSLEFGGAVLSHWAKPPIDLISSTDYHLHLLQSVDLFAKSQNAIHTSSTLCG